MCKFYIKQRINGAQRKLGEEICIKRNKWNRKIELKTEMSGKVSPSIQSKICNNGLPFSHILYFIGVASCLGRPTNQ